MVEAYIIEPVPRGSRVSADCTSRIDYITKARTDRVTVVSGRATNGCGLGIGNDCILARRTTSRIGLVGDSGFEGRSVCCLTVACVAAMTVSDGERCEFRPFTRGLPMYAFALRAESSSPELVEASRYGPVSYSRLNKDGCASGVFLV